jgi:osmotically-inducible protein OsmY
MHRNPTITGSATSRAATRTRITASSSAPGGNNERLQRNEPSRYGEGGGQALARGYRGRGPKNFTRSDARIQEDISERLWNADDVDASLHCPAERERRRNVAG